MSEEPDTYAVPQTRVDIGGSNVGVPNDDPQILFGVWFESQETGRFHLSSLDAGTIRCVLVYGEPYYPLRAAEEEKKP